MKNKEIQALREDYTQYSLDITDVEKNPISQFEKWLQQAIDTELPEPNAFTIATVDADAKPHARVVLLKGIEEDGFIFYTNYESDKARDMAQNPNVAACFLWLGLERQVRIEGTVEKISRSKSEAYFKSRPVKSQIGALASNQSREVSSRAELEQEFEKLEAQYSNGNVPMPEQWGGYKIKPVAIEFWQGRRSRLHDRIKYEWNGSAWTTKRLAP